MSRNKVNCKTSEELKIMRDGGKILADIVRELSKHVVEGNTSAEVDKYAAFLCKRYKVKPAFLGYPGMIPFPGVICANLNEVIVHGVPNNVPFRKGDVFGLDMGIVYYGMNLDMSVTLTIGEVSPEVSQFLDKTKLSMMQGINAAKPGNHIGMVSSEMNRGLLDTKFSLMRDFIGHGIGHQLHEEPDIPGIGMKPEEGIEIKPGMVFAIESISVMGPSNEYSVGRDHWTVYTKDRKYLSGLFEHTVIVTEGNPEVITL